MQTASDLTQVLPRSCRATLLDLRPAVAVAITMADDPTLADEPTLPTEAATDEIAGL